jgi:hypothetical protein
MMTPVTQASGPVSEPSGRRAATRLAITHGSQSLWLRSARYRLQRARLRTALRLHAGSRLHAALRLRTVAVCVSFARPVDTQIACGEQSALVTMCSADPVSRCCMMRTRSGDRSPA